MNAAPLSRTSGTSMLGPDEDDATNSAIAIAAHSPAMPRTASARRARLDEHTLLLGAASC